MLTFVLLLFFQFPFTPIIFSAIAISQIFTLLLNLFLLIKLFCVQIFPYCTLNKYVHKQYDKSQRNIYQQFEFWETLFLTKNIMTIFRLKWVYSKMRNANVMKNGCAGFSRTYYFSFCALVCWPSNLQSYKSSGVMPLLNKALREFESWRTRIEQPSTLWKRSKSWNRQKESKWIINNNNNKYHNRTVSSNCILLFLNIILEF